MQVQEQDKEIGTQTRADPGGISVVELASECDGEPRLRVLAPVDASREACEREEHALKPIGPIGWRRSAVGRWQGESRALAWFGREVFDSQCN